MIKNLRYLLDKCSHGQKKQGVGYGTTKLFKYMNNDISPFVVENQICVSYSDYQLLYNNTFQKLLNKNLRYFLAKCSHGQKKQGVEYGPTELFKYINNELPPFVVENKNFLSNSGYQLLYKNVTKSLLNNELPVIIGGDHSISSGTVPAVFDVFKNDVSVIWIDAHADINTPETSTTQNLHGMPVASIFKLMNPIVQSKYQPTYDQIIYLGLRDIDKPEKKLLDKHNITYYSQKNIQQNGIPKIFEYLNKLTKQNVHISFDIDAMDPSLISATGTPVKNGMNLSEVEMLISNIKQNKTVTSIDFVEYNPFIYDKNKNTLLNSLKILEMLTN